MSEVKSSAEFIAWNAEFVTVDTDQCTRVATDINNRMMKRSYSVATWSSHQLNPSASDEHVVDWIFTVDTLNFSFWQDEPRFTVTYQGKAWTGYWSMVAAINRALDERIPITSPKFWSSADFTPELVAHVFRSDISTVRVPLFKERYQVLKQAGEALAKLGYTSFEQVLEVNTSALGLVRWLTRHIPSYNDRAEFHGREVQLYKRAQILVADLWACGAAKFSGVDDITMFADYRVPQILSALGCLRYADELKSRLQSKEPLAQGSPEEVEIRGCSIMAVELIVQEINRIANRTVNAILVDFYLWDTAKEDEVKNTEIIECHRTRSVYY